MKKPTIIEFAGLHGSGKTTTAYRLADDLKALGYIVKTNQDLWLESENIFSPRRWVSYFLSPVTWSFVAHALINILFQKIDKNKVKNKYDNKHILGPIKDIWLRNYFCTKVWSEVDFIVWDEGSIYVISDLVWKYKLPKKYIDTYIDLATYLKNTYIYMFTINTTLSVKRTEERNNGSFIDELSKDMKSSELAEASEYYAYAYEYILNTEKYSIQMVSPEKLLESRVGDICSKLVTDF